MQSRAPLLSRADRDRFLQFIALHEARIAVEREALERLSKRVQTARVVEAGEVPRDMVTMYSQVRLQDLENQRSFIITAALPDPRANAALSRAYLSAVLLGSRVGDEIAWEQAGRHHRLRVEQVLFQPERRRSPVFRAHPLVRNDAGAFDLVVDRDAKSDTALGM